MKSNKNFNVLNDYFMRYMFDEKINEHIFENLINSVRIDANQEHFKSIEVLNSFWCNLLSSMDKLEDIIKVLVNKNPILKEGYNEYYKFVNNNYFI